MTEPPYPPAVDGDATPRLGRWVRRRLLLCAALLAGLFLPLVQRAYQLQVTESEALTKMAEDQHRQLLELPARRGRILDRHETELASSAEVDSVHANGRVLAAAGKVEESAHALAAALHLDARDLERRLRDKRYFLWLKRRVSPEEARAVRELALPGVVVDKEPRRYYPERWLAGPLLGWAGLDSHGQEGLELQYEDALRGTRSEVVGVRDALGRAVLIGGLGDPDDVAGHDLHTTIDRFIQYRLEQALERGVAQHRAKGAVAVALDPDSGEVLAMASVPTLNPNDPSGAAARGVRNRAVTDPFEPGSTIKTLSIAAALEAKLVRLDEHWFCENGKFLIGSSLIHDAERIGDATTVQVLAESSNICTAKIAFRSGKERVREMLTRLGLGKPTGVDLPGERAGNIPALPRMGPIELATVAYGQGMTATPLQIAAAYAAIGNGGVWHRPRVARRITDAHGQVVRAFVDESHRVLAPEIAEQLRLMLHAVSQKGGTGASLSLPGYSFGGKTGTAMKVDPERHAYSTDKWASSFVGFAPKEHPRLVLFVMVDEPQGSHYGAMVAGPIWQETMADALRWLDVPPDLALAARPTPKPSKPVAVSATAPLVADDGRTVPDFTGLGVAEALVQARRRGLVLDVVGSGVAVAQSPGPGERSLGGAARVQFAPVY